MRPGPLALSFAVTVLCLNTGSADNNSGWSFVPNTQYHIQTDEGPERHFRYQTLNGQYRKEKRLVDGTVIGTEGWLDPLGYLRLKDYVADSNGFRILRSKMVYVGKDRPIYDAVAETKRAPPQTGILVDPARPPNPYRHWKPTSAAPLVGNDISSGYYESTTARPRAYYDTNRAGFAQHPGSHYNLLQRSDGGDNARYDSLKNDYQVPAPVSRGAVAGYPAYDGTHSTANGFQYYLKRQYHEEEQEPTGGNVGSFGYVDPFGIRRVIYYKTDPRAGGGFVHQKNNKFVGLSGTPYDPSPPRPRRGSERYRRQQ
ncbi:uncharacterized protein LOC117227125 isoform X1 [Megalopta genalis]|uniref:uncharacterized protein LOC117227125 isoform X1 n=1 Tax=Megalopta genalis TaxID=115081 RepID=UPI0014436B6C|nr:uncharacterized protein LOC117227125 isoform X2 [Megalopta genalis]